MANAARIVTVLVHAYCRETWPDEGAGMASTVFDGSFADAFDIKEHGSYKYIPADKLTADLGEPQDAGVFGYCRLYDGSYVLKTCNGRLAHWTGKDTDAAIWGD